MQRSVDRILTTHVGSLPRTQAVTEVLFARDRGESRIRKPRPTITDAVAEVVRRQVATGIDVVSDGEMSKISYATYVAERFAGFGGDTPREPGQDLVEFPGLLTKLAERGATARYRRPRCVGEIRVRKTEPLQADLANLRAAVAAAPTQPADAFLNAASPGVIALFQPNDYYRTQDEYLAALAEALRAEYEAVVQAGFLLQIDAPDLAMGRHTMYRSRSLEEFERLAAMHIEVLNHALRNCPAERLACACAGATQGRIITTCRWSACLIDVLQARPQGLLFKANPRHAHEWSVRTRSCPTTSSHSGVISSTTNYIEHSLLRRSASASPVVGLSVSSRARTAVRHLRQLGPVGRTSPI
jgi:5-methyltetrahydropteroyltriglutamate--homocysteine methyltransferase